ncbi:Eukaryotic translation initiation factor 4E-1 [Capsicum annuum]|nr:Eukaryotic translation initiation factor 4E-1 [Capsicum annuum]
MADEGNKTTMLGEYKTSSMEDGGEEGEIVGESNATTSSSLGKPITMKHPLEHSWTFWFDNPSGKSKQAAWGSSIRPIYTFSTAEDFWRALVRKFSHCALISVTDLCNLQFGKCCWKPTLLRGIPTIFLRFPTTEAIHLVRRLVAVQGKIEGPAHDLHMVFITWRRHTEDL